MTNLIIGIISIISLFVLSYRNKNKYVLRESVSDSNSLISVIIPARNESSNLKNLLPSLYEQSYVNFEVIVANDESSDDTKKVSASFGAKVVDINDRPPKAKPKAYACHQGYLESTGDIIVFVDADTFMSKNFLSSLVDVFVKENVEIVSVQPFHKSKKMFEQLSLFFHFVSVVGSGIFSTIKIDNGIYGPCIAFTKNTYESTKGFANNNVMTSVIEDYELSRVMEINNIKYSRKIGLNIFQYRMYSSLKDLFYGWTKNISRGATKTNPLIVLAMVIMIGSMVSMPLNIFYGDQTLQAINLICFLILLVMFIRIALKLGNYVLGIAFYPVCIMFFIVTFMFALLSQIFKKEIVWANRKIKA
ncbi:MAG: glycosyltransferase [Acidimicrobiia bacterium]